MSLYLSLSVAPVVRFMKSAFWDFESSRSIPVQLVLSNPTSTPITIQMITMDVTATGNYFLFYWNIYDRWYSIGRNTELSSNDQVSSGKI